MIQSDSFSLKECECGVEIKFENPKNKLPIKDEYFIYFNLESSLPTEIPATVELTPSSYTITGTKDFIPNVIATITSVHRGETQSLIRLVIKDRFGKILYNDYRKTICVPIAKVELEGNLKSPPENIGPKGGSLLTITTSTEELDIGMDVTGEGITLPTTIASIVSLTEIELSRVISYVGVKFTKSIYTFKRLTSCVDPELLRLRAAQSQYIFLNKENNWTYKYSDKVIAKFVREDTDNEDISIILLAKNRSNLPDDSQKSDFPGVAYAYARGRVTNDQNCIP